MDNPKLERNFNSLKDNKLKFVVMVIANILTFLYILVKRIDFLSVYQNKRNILYNSVIIV